MKLRTYQETAVAHLHAHRRAGLFLDMGLGKTAICLTALTSDHLPALVVAPKRVAEEVWDVEGAKWRPDLRVGVAKGSPAQRRAVLTDRSYDVVAIGQDNLGDPAVLNRQWRTFIIDELSGYKKFGGVRWKNAKRISLMRGDAEFVWGLTGTPAPNGYEDLFAQLYLLDGGKRLGRTITPYRNQHFTQGRRLPNGAIIDRELLPGHDLLINAKIEDICLAMKNDGLVDLPPVTFNPVDVPMSASVRKLYETTRTDLVLDLKALGIGDYVHTAPTAAALSNRLSQIAAGFIYQDPDDVLPGEKQAISWLHTERVKAVREIVDGSGSPVLLAYRYKPELDMLKKEFGADLHTVKSPNVFKRWDAGKVPILAAHPGSVGHGLNLQYGGHTVVWASPTWSLEHWDQLNARLPRSGQLHPVTIHMLQTAGTVDAKVYGALRRKDKVQQALLEHLESPV